MSQHPYLFIQQTGTKTAVSLVRPNGDVLGTVTAASQVTSRRNGWLELDALEIVHLIQMGIAKVVTEAGVPASDIAGIGVVTDASTCIWNRESGVPYSGAITLTQAPLSATPKVIIHKRLHQTIYDATGLHPAPCYLPYHLQWLARHHSYLRADLETGACCVGTMGCWILYNLTGRQRFYTDPSHATKTLLFNRETQEWDRFLLDTFDVPLQALPDVKASNLGMSTSFFPLPDGIPILLMRTSEQARLAGSVTQPFGDGYVYWGEQGYVMVNVGESDPQDLHPFLQTPLYQHRPQRRAVVGYFHLPDLQNIISITPLDMQNLAFRMRSSLPFIVPGADLWNFPYQKKPANVGIFGLESTTQPRDLVSGHFASGVFQLQEFLTELQKGLGSRLRQIHLIGPFSKLPMLVQFIADITQLPVELMARDSLFEGMLRLIQKESPSDATPTTPPLLKTVLPILDPSSSQALFDQWLNYRALLKA